MCFVFFNISVYSTTNTLTKTLSSYIYVGEILSTFSLYSFCSYLCDGGGCYNNLVLFCMRSIFHWIQPAAIQFYGLKITQLGLLHLHEPVRICLHPLNKIGLELLWPTLVLTFIWLHICYILKLLHNQTFLCVWF